MHDYDGTSTYTVLLQLLIKDFDTVITQQFTTRNTIYIVLYTGAVYFTLTNIDPAQRSTLDAIYLVALFPCSILSTYSIDVILEPFFDDIAKLSGVSTLHVTITA